MTDPPHYEVLNRYGDLIARGEIEFKELGEPAITVIDEACLPPLRTSDRIRWHNLTPGDGMPDA